MIVALDATVLLMFLYPNISAPVDGEGKPIDKAKERIEYLISALSKQSNVIIIPTPALSEVLVHEGKAINDILDMLRKKACFRISDFDQRAAVEVALMSSLDRVTKNKSKKKIERSATIAKVKYDRQIAAIAKVEGAEILYTDDENLTKIATRLDIKVISTSDLPLPPEDAQMKLMLNAPDIPRDIED